MRKQRPKEVKQLSSGYTSVKLWDLEIDQVYLTSSTHIWMWELDYKESWAPKNWCFWTVVLERLLSPLDCKRIQPVHPKGNQSWIFIGKTDAKAETPILWPPCKELTHWKRPWCWEWLKVGGEGDNRGWGSWIESPTQWIWGWVNARSWWWTGRPGVLQSMRMQRVGHNWAAGVLQSMRMQRVGHNWATELNYLNKQKKTGTYLLSWSWTQSCFFIFF